MKTTTAAAIGHFLFSSTYYQARKMLNLTIKQRAKCASWSWAWARKKRGEKSPDNLTDNVTLGNL